MNLQDEQFVSEFIQLSSDRQDPRKTFRAARKRRVRDAELRVRRERALKKKLRMK